MWKFPFLLLALLAASRVTKAQFFDAISPVAGGLGPCTCAGVPWLLPYIDSLLGGYRNQVFFRLYTRSSQASGGELLFPGDAALLLSSSFDPQLPLKVITHGYWEKADAPVMVGIKDALFSLPQSNMNVILVDWSKLASTLDYSQAVNRAMYVGRILAEFLFTIKNNYPGFSGEQVHLIGFSMGAHVSGIAGHNFPGIDRITGLDPAGPSFICAPEIERLTTKSATFVDVIHTNDGCLWEGFIGHKTQTGHQDFYVNGGGTQPNCPLFGIEAITSFATNMLNMATFGLSKGNPIICHHHRAILYFVESIRSQQNVLGYQCSNYKAFEKGDCLENPKTVFGYRAQRGGTHGSFYLKTQQNEAFLSKYLKIEPRESNTGALPGRLGIRVTGRNGIPNETVMFRNGLLQVSPELESGMVTVPLSTQLNDLAFTLIYEPNLLSGFFRSAQNILDTLEVVVLDATDSKTYCVTSRDTRQNLNTYFVRLVFGSC